MARTAKKDVYSRIADKKDEIRQAEETLCKLNEDLKLLLREQDELEMAQMLNAIREQGIDINEALKLLSNPNNKNSKVEKTDK